MGNHFRSAVCYLVTNDRRQGRFNYLSSTAGGVCRTIIGSIAGTGRLVGGHIVVITIRIVRFMSPKPSDELDEGYSWKILTVKTDVHLTNITDTRSGRYINCLGSTRNSFDNCCRFFCSWEHERSSLKKYCDFLAPLGEQQIIALYVMLVKIYFYIG